MGAETFMDAQRRRDDESADALPFWLAWAGSLLAPRSVGRGLVGRGIGDALTAHLLALATIATLLYAGGFALEEIGLAPSSAYIAELRFALLRFERLPMREKLVAAAPWAAGSAVLAGCYWLLAGTALSAWMCVNLPRLQRLKCGAVLAGYATLWLLPVLGGWLLAQRIAGLHLGRNDTAQLVQGLAIALLATGVPALSMVGPLRLARGLGEALAEGQPPLEDYLCEWCGYNLHATPFESRCPECGTPAAASISPVARCMGWEVGTRGFWATAGAVLLDPGGTLRRMKTLGAPNPARRFLAWTTCISAAVLGAMMALSFLAYASHFGLDWDDAAMALFVGVLTAGAWATGVPIVSLLIAAGLIDFSRRQKDRLGGCGGTKIACYLSALSLPWSVLIGLLGVVTWTFVGKGYTGPDYARTYALAWILVGTGLLIWYWLACARAYNACRFANR